LPVLAGTVLFVDAWPDLPEAVKADIVVMVTAAEK
jgi:hypothetical protein